MMPRPTFSAYALATGLFVGLLVGAVLGAPAATAASGVGLSMLAAVYLATLPIARRLRAETIELAWWVDAEGSIRRDRVVAGKPFLLRCFVRHHGFGDVRVRGLALVSDSVELVDPSETFRFDVPARSRSDFSVRCVCPAPGVGVLHGARAEIDGPLGLFAIQLYFPNRLRLAVLPARARSRSAVHTPLDARAIPRRASRARRDEGTDIHELRELRPGDPFRHIAWKTSARVGRLVVRELEREELGSVELVLDVGPSMRDGPHGERRIERAVSLALGIAEDALRRGERVGLVTADRRVLERVEPDSRPDQRERILDVLLSGLSCVDGDRTVEDDPEVGRIVARYVRFQEGIDFLDPLTADGVHLEKLALHVVGKIRRFHDVNARTQAGRIVRRYAEHVGIPLQHRTDRDVRARSEGIVAALAEIKPRRRAPSRIVVLTDGIDVDFATAVRPAMMNLRRRGHVMEVLLVPRPLPHARELGIDATSVLAASFLEDDLARLRGVSTTLRSLGVGVGVDVPSPRPAEVA